MGANLADAARCCEDLVNVLLAEGAAWNVKNRARQTPADVAQEAEHRELALRLRA